MLWTEVHVRLWALAACAAALALAAETRGASERSLVFSAESASNFVTLAPGRPMDLSAFTLCLRLATELPPQKREIILFAYRTRHFDELNLWRELDGRIGLYLSGDGVQFQMPRLGPMQTHLCITWDSQSGATTVFMDGKKGLTKIYKKGHNVRSGGSVIIGQDPDDYLGSFEASQSFVGEMSDINLWSYVLSDGVIRSIADKVDTSQHGDVIDWSTANAEVTGQVEPRTRPPAAMHIVVDAAWAVWSIVAGVYDYFHTSAMEERIHALENVLSVHQVVIAALSAGLILLVTYILVRKH